MENKEIRHIESDIAGISNNIFDDDKRRIENLVKLYEKTILANLKEDYNRNIKKSEKVADKIAEFGGSWKFIIILGSTLIIWLMWNIVPFTKHFDPMPFVLLNLVLSFTASFQAPIIMMSQNRKAMQDKNEAIIDFALNYKAEKDISDMQGHLHRIEKEVYEIKKLLEENSKNK